MTKEKLIENILERLKDYEDNTGVIEIWNGQLRLLLKEYLQELTEEMEVEIHWLWGNFPYLCTCQQECRDHNWHIFNYCSYCGKKIKRLQ